MKNSKWLTIGMLLAALAARPFHGNAQVNVIGSRENIQETVEKIVMGLDNGKIRESRVCIPLKSSRDFGVIVGDKLEEYTIGDYIIGGYKGLCDTDGHTGFLYEVQKQ